LAFILTSWTCKYAALPNNTIIADGN
jgi:hypothetical protein